MPAVGELPTAVGFVEHAGGCLWRRAFRAWLSRGGEDDTITPRVATLLLLGRADGFPPAVDHRPAAARH